MGDPVADRIASALLDAPDGLTRTEISALFGRHRRSSDIDRALDGLKKDRRAEYIQEATDGRPGERWKLCGT